MASNDCMWDDELDQANIEENYRLQEQESQQNNLRDRRYEESQQNNWRDRRYDEPQQNNWRDRRYEESQQNNRRNGRYDDNQDRFQDRRPKRNGLEFEIGPNEIGRVIGQGGSNIRDFEKRSNCSIKVDTSGDEAMVRIFGKPEDQENAKKMIEESLGRFSNLYIEEEDPNEPFDWDKVREQMARKEKERLARFEAQMPITKVFYFEHPEVAHFTPEQVAQIRESKNNIIVSLSKEGDPRKIPNPVTAFKHAFERYPEIMRELKKQGFKEPSPIQCQAWPVIMKGYDLVGIAQTGTGKTIAFLLPAFIHIVNQAVPMDQRVGPTCLILAPTRELALQILAETQKYKYRGIRSVCVYGGGNRREQIEAVKGGVEVVIATPGRLLDLIAIQALDLINVTYLVLDEADRMLDLGFEVQIKAALRHIRPDRQTIMTSATWPPEVQAIVDTYMSDPIQVNVGSLELIAAHSVEQRFIFTDDEDEKRNLLFSFIENMDKDDKLLVFVEKKALVDDLASDIVLGYNVECASIHGDREQCDREQALEDFKSGYARVLIATDVASRGLDVKDVSHVFNMAMPRDIEDYVHRIGRTGRAGKSGISITIISWSDRRKVSELIKILEEAGQHVPSDLYRMEKSHQKWLQDRPDYKPKRRWRN